MPIKRLLRSPRARRSIAASAIVLSLGGLVLFHAPAGATSDPISAASYRNGTSFAGPGAQGTFSLSHGKILANGDQRVFAELRVRADQASTDLPRTPLSIAIVLDTSGSMEGDKIREARRSVTRLLDQMRPDDEVAFIRYDSRADVVQPMARVADVRESLRGQIHELDASGGTNIPWALRAGMDALANASPGRVQRLVLVSDGIDNTRAQAEAIATSATDKGVTLSSLGVGLDFDEGYLSAVARAGRGNFGFVENAQSLEKFLSRELVETASTSVSQVTARVELPRGLRLRRAVGADIRRDGRDIELRVGSLYSGDERRIVLELEADADLGDQLTIASRISWKRVGGGMADIELDSLSMVATGDDDAVVASRDGRVWSSGISALASIRQLEAAEAYAKGDTARARKLIDESMAELDEAAAAAPAPMAKRIRRQRSGYAETDKKFRSTSPGSAEGRAAAKQSAAEDAANLDREGWEGK